MTKELIEEIKRWIYNTNYCKGEPFVQFYGDKDVYELVGNKFKKLTDKERDTPRVKYGGL